MKTYTCASCNTQYAAEEVRRYCNSCKGLFKLANDEEADSNLYAQAARINKATLLARVFAEHGATAADVSAGLPDTAWSTASDLAGLRTKTHSHTTQALVVVIMGINDRTAA